MAVNPTVSCGPDIFIQEEDLFGGSPFSSANEAAANTARGVLIPSLTLASNVTDQDGGEEFVYRGQSGDTVAVVAATPLPTGEWTVDRVTSCSDQVIDYAGKG